MSESLADFIANARRHDTCGLLPPAIHSPKPEEDSKMTDGQTEVQEQSLTTTERRPPTRSTASELPGLFLSIRPAACHMWRWVLYQGSWIIAEGTPRATERSAEDSARWMLVHAFVGEISHTELNQNSLEITVMSEAELTLQRKVGAVRDLLKKAAPQIARALPSHLTPERMLRIVETCVQRSPKLLDADPRSLIGAVVEASQLGLEPDGILGHAYLVPFHNKKTQRLEVQLIPGFKGLMDLAYRSGKVATIHPAVVCENDRYTYTEGVDATLEHIPSSGERGEVIAAYAVATLTGGVKAHVWLWRTEIDKARASSRAGDTGPWKTHFEEMAKKTAVRRLCKELPVSVIQRAAEHQERADSGEGQTFLAQLDFDSSEVIDVASADPTVTDTEPAGEEEARGAFAKVKCLKECDQVANSEMWRDLPKDVVARLREERKAEIRGARGERSNKVKSEAETPPAELDPAQAASEERRKYLLKSVGEADRPGAVDLLDKDAKTMEEQGDLSPQHREEVTDACDGRRAELIGKG